MSVDVPRDPTSERYAEKAAEREAYAAHLAQVQAATYRVGAVGWRWQVARREPSGPWQVLPAELEHYPGEDIGTERRRVSRWLADDVLRVTTVWCWLDHAAADEGRLVFEVDVRL